MPDPRLFDMMHHHAQPFADGSSDNSCKKDRYEVAIEESIKCDVDALIKDGCLPCSKLLPPAACRSKLEQEKKASCDLSELSCQLTSALHILEKDKAQLLSKTACESIVETLHLMGRQLASLELHTLSENSLAEAFSAGKNIAPLILQVAIEKYTQKVFSESLALFVLLTLLDGSCADYWYRLGMVAQRSLRCELAVRAYAAAALLAPDFVAIPIFAAECYLEMGMHAAAIAELAKAKYLLDSTIAEDEWHRHFAALKTALSLGHTAY